jgi:hypothetical protein
MTLKTAFVAAIACVALVFAVPAAWGDRWGADRKDQAVSQARPDDRAGPLGVGAVTLLERVAARRVDTAPSRPDDRAGTRGAGAISASSHSAAAASVGSTFHWDDAALGAAGAVLGLLLIGSAVGLMTRRRGRVILS